MFYIPAQRVMCLSRGLPLRFVDFQAGDPFVLRQFSETIYQTMLRRVLNLDELSL